MQSEEKQLQDVPFPIWSSLVPPKYHPIQRRQSWLSLLLLNTTIRTKLLHLFFEKIDPAIAVQPLLEGCYLSSGMTSEVAYFLQIRGQEMLAYAESCDLLRVEKGRFGLVKGETERGWKVELVWEGKEVQWRDSSELSYSWMCEEEGTMKTVDQLTVVDPPKGDTNGNEILNEIPLLSLEFQRFPRLPYPIKFHKKKYYKVKDFRDSLNYKKSDPRGVLCGIGWGRGRPAPASDEVILTLSEMARKLIEKIPKDAADYNDVLLNMSCIIEGIGSDCVSHDPKELQKSFILEVSDRFPDLQPYLN